SIRGQWNLMVSPVIRQLIEALAEATLNATEDIISLDVMRQLPASPLFPYTTLFRSPAEALDRLGHRPARERLVRHAAGEPQPERDRKSTRLNSSHSQISYAVFCLKKKKKWTSWLRIYRLLGRAA